jgi:hypothetical protein
MHLTMRVVMGIVLATTIVVDAHAFATPPVRRQLPMHLAILGRWKVVCEKATCDDATAVIVTHRILAHVGSTDETLDYEIVREEPNALHIELVLDSERRPVEVERDAATNDLFYEVLGIRSRLVPLP